MMGRTRPVRRYTRWPARWPMLYGNEEFVAKGTALDVTAKGWRMAGPMPVYPGMRLNFWIWPTERPHGIHVEDATVLWVKGYEFGLAVQDTDPIDREWLTQFLHSTLEWCWVLQAA
jgi:PilZ domain